ncbi:MAG TPA: SRPBCC family protein [Myxococcaceae bacterium]|nr:SRPBCC family protein [Myxococcaceae bacterium]
MDSTTNVIEKRVTLKAPRERVWSALTNAAEFGIWFGAKVDGAFTPHTRVEARLVPTQMDPKIAAMQAGFADTPFTLFIEEMVPPSRFTFRWHAYEAAPGEPEPVTTLVEFDLEEAEGQTVLRIRESGFDKVPLERRAKAFSDNDGGWTLQGQLIATYLERAQG